MSIDNRLTEIGDAIERAARIDVTRGSAAPTSTRTPRTRFRTRRFTAMIAALVVAVPAAAVAATQLLSDSQVADSIPAGTLALVGTHPSCTVVKAGVEYHCKLAQIPSENGGPLPGQWKGTVEATVDNSKHVNGGCRSLNGAGTEWECYVGKAAVSQSIIGAGFLGAYAPSPGVG